MLCYLHRNLAAQSVVCVFKNLIFIVPNLCCIQNVIGEKQSNIWEIMLNRNMTFLFVLLQLKDYHKESLSDCNAIQ